MVRSQFAAQLACPHCQRFPQDIKEWPVGGDMTAIYSQKSPGNFNVKVTCKYCGQEWYVVWDSDPGHIVSLER